MNSSLPEELLGAWRMVSFEDRDTEDDAWERPLGDNAEGVMVIDRSGTLSVQIHAPAAAAGDGYPTYVGYFGSGVAHDVVRTDGSVRGTLILDLRGGHPASVLESNDPRPFEITGDTCVLGDQKTWRRTIQRIG